MVKVQSHSNDTPNTNQTSIFQKKNTVFLNMANDPYGCILKSDFWIFNLQSTITTLLIMFAPNENVLKVLQLGLAQTIQKGKDVHSEAQKDF